MDADDIKIDRGGEFGTDDVVDYRGNMEKLMAPLADADEDDRIDLTPPPHPVNRPVQLPKKIEPDAAKVILDSVQEELASATEETVHILELSMSQAEWDEQFDLIQKLLGRVPVDREGNIVVPDDVVVKLVVQDKK